MDQTRRNLLKTLSVSGLSSLTGCSGLPDIRGDTAYRIVTPPFDRQWRYKFQVETTAREPTPVTVSVIDDGNTVASHTFRPTRSRSREAAFNRSPEGLTLRVSSGTRMTTVDWKLDTKTQDLHPGLTEDAECPESDLRIIVPAEKNKAIRFDWSCLD